ncbi:TPA: hypothetical protein ACH3X2_008301 [Trebouxia sp. C0005]
MVTKFAPLTLALCVASLRLASCQTSFDDDYSVNDLDDYQIYERGYDTFEDDAIDQTYFDPYIGDYDDPYGDSLLQDLAVLKDCQIAADGSPSFNAARVLWYSTPHQDWDITNGSTPQEEDILMWGGFGGGEDRPQQVKTAWHLAAEFMSNFTLTGPEYLEVDGATVSCVDGSEADEVNPPAQQRPKSSLLTDEEQDAQYRAVINAARQNADVSSGLNSGFIVLFVFAGLAIVVVLPFMIAKKKGMRRAPGDAKGGISLSNLFGGKAAHSN